MSRLACIGQPISWLRLEMFAAGSPDPAVREHVSACPACKLCLEEIETDLVALPPLAVPAVAPKRRWWTTLVPAFAVAAAAMIAIVVWRGREQPRVVREDAALVKGVGEVILGTVRERDGLTRDDVRSFAAGDRWKLVVTCPPAANGVELAVDVTVVEVGSAGIDRPLVPTTIACGNRVVLPGAFSLTGSRANRVCAAIGPDHETACVTIAPE